MKAICTESIPRHASPLRQQGPWWRNGLASKSRAVKFGSSVLLPLVLLGCSGPALEFAEVEGQVTLNKKPLSGVLVRFYPVSAGKEQLPYATGMTDADGKYTLWHHDRQAGALVGPNRAVVTWPSRDMRNAGRDKPLPPPTETIPIQYTVASDTPLVVEVKSGGRQTIDLPIVD
jgi:hypothetical protein